jgi:hypothetical protein
MISFLVLLTTRQVGPEFEPFLLLGADGAELLGADGSYLRWGPATGILGASGADLLGADGAFLTYS